MVVRRNDGAVGAGLKPAPIRDRRFKSKTLREELGAEKAGSRPPFSMLEAPEYRAICLSHDRVGGVALPVRSMDQSLIALTRN